jgi:hypothetical protein
VKGYDAALQAVSIKDESTDVGAILPMKYRIIIESDRLWITLRCRPPGKGHGLERRVANKD